MFTYVNVNGYTAQCYVAAWMGGECAGEWLLIYLYLYLYGWVPLQFPWNYHNIVNQLRVPVQSLSCVWLFVTPWTVAHQSPLSMGQSWQEILEWVVISSSRGSSWPKDWTHVSGSSCTGRQILYHWVTWEAH